MKRILLLLVGFVIAGIAFPVRAEFASNPGADRPLRVLLIGNSFSESVKTFLPKIASEVPGCKLTLETAMIGSCSLEKHVKEYEKSVKDSSHRPYKGKHSLPELLDRKWDVIAIQQHSLRSPDWKTYQPWADRLIAIIRKHDPGAEIVVQETWSYNAGSPYLVNRIGCDQNEMYRRLADCYRKLAQANGFRVVPVGYCVQLTRAGHPKQFPLITKELEAAIGKKEVPLPENGDVVGSARWPRSKDKKFFIDTIHLNVRGHYMQACVWFGFLFRRPVSDVTYEPKGLAPGDAKFLKQCAQKALDEYRVPLKIQTDRLRVCGEKDAMCEFEAATQSGNRRKVARCGLSSKAASRRNEFFEVPYRQPAAIPGSRSYAEFPEKDRIKPQIVAFIH